jgi:hypothetical protein
MYTSNVIQNELIASLHHNLIEQLKKEFSQAVSFSVMVDETSDLSHKEHDS